MTSIWSVLQLPLSLNSAHWTFVCNLGQTKACIWWPYIEVWNSSVAVSDLSWKDNPCSHISLMTMHDVLMPSACLVKIEMLGPLPRHIDDNFRVWNLEFFFLAIPRDDYKAPAGFRKITLLFIWHFLDIWLENTPPSSNCTFTL